MDQEKIHIFIFKKTCEVHVWVHWTGKSFIYTKIYIIEFSGSRMYPSQLLWTYYTWNDIQWIRGIHKMFIQYAAVKRDDPCNVCLHYYYWDITNKQNQAYCTIYCMRLFTHLHGFVIIRNSNSHIYKYLHDFSP